LVCGLMGKSFSTHQKVLLWEQEKTRPKQKVCFRQEKLKDYIRFRNPLFQNTLRIPQQKHIISIGMCEFSGSLMFVSTLKLKCNAIAAERLFVVSVTYKMIKLQKMSTMT